MNTDRSCGWEIPTECPPPPLHPIPHDTSRVEHSGPKLTTRTPYSNNNRRGANRASSLLQHLHQTPLVKHHGDSSLYMTSINQSINHQLPPAADPGPQHSRSHIDRPHLEDTYRQSLQHTSIQHFIFTYTNELRSLSSDSPLIPTVYSLVIPRQ